MEWPAHLSLVGGGGVSQGTLGSLVAKPSLLSRVIES